MNKTELAREMVHRINGGDDSAGLPMSLGREFVENLLAVVTEELKKDGKVVMSGFGTLHVRNQSARMGVNPRTGDSLRIPARRIPAFKPGKVLKDLVR